MREPPVFSNTKKGKVGFAGKRVIALCETIPVILVLLKAQFLAIISASGGIFGIWKLNRIHVDLYL